VKAPELPSSAPAPAVTPHAPVPAKAPRAAPPRIDPHARDDDRLCDPPTDEPHHETIIGSGDRAHHLALVPGTAVALLRAPSARTQQRLQATRPASRQACERRCGKAGQCDPASPFGCGGEFCQGFEGRLY